MKMLTRRAARPAIGQSALLVTPMHMALLADAFANGGKVMKPYLVQDVITPGGTVVYKAQPSRWLTATTSEMASVIDSYMEDVVTKGTGTAAPDMATVTIGVTTQGKDAAKAQNDNAWVSNQIQAAVRGLGIAEKDIQTRNYSFYPNYSTDKDRRNEVTGYTVNNSVIVVVRDIKLTGKVIDAALNNGANEIN